jgi:hypothetical protein
MMQLNQNGVLSSKQQPWRTLFVYHEFCWVQLYYKEEEPVGGGIDPDPVQNVNALKMKVHRNFQLN